MVSEFSDTCLQEDHHSQGREEEVRKHCHLFSSHILRHYISTVEKQSGEKLLDWAEEAKA
jgi:hypothetical protein